MDFKHCYLILWSGICFWGFRQTAEEKLSLVSMFYSCGKTEKIYMKIIKM